MKNPPNIIYVVCHDLGKELGCYGKPIKTPNIDNFAEEGLKFTNYFCSSPACSPSRCCAYTGMYAHTNGTMGIAHMGWPLPEEVKTIVDYFNEGGYETAHAGFQHERHYSKNRYQVEMYRKPEDVYVENAVDRAVEYLKSRRNSKKPFYLNVGTMEVHASTWLDQRDDNEERKKVYGTLPPEEAYIPDNIPDTPEIRKEMANFQACTQYYDSQIKRLLDAIKELGYNENTLVVLTTDHGISNERAKGTLYDAGVEIMMLMQMPGVLGEGIVIDQLLQNIDIAPTLLEAAGLKIPESMQGKSFWPLLTGGEYKEHEMIFIERNYHGAKDYDPMRAVRTREYHYIRNFGDSPKKEWLPDEVPYMNNTYNDWHNGLWPERTIPRNREELFKVTEDPKEFRDLSEDIEFAAVKAKLAQTLDNWMKETEDPLLKGPIELPDRGDSDSIWPGMK